MATAPPAGTIPIRQQLKAYGVPDSWITYDADTGNVRVGSQTIQPAANVQGTTYADPAAIQAVASKILEMQPQASPGQVVAPGEPQQGLQRALGAVGQMAPQLDAIAQMLGTTHAQELAAQTALSDAWRATAQTAGQFGEAPINAPFFADVLSPLAGQITEGRRASQAQESIARGHLAIAQQQAQAQADARRQQQEALIALASQFPEDQQALILPYLQAGGAMPDMGALLDAAGFGSGSGLMSELEIAYMMNPKMSTKAAEKIIQDYQKNPNVIPATPEEVRAALDFIESRKAEQGPSLFERWFDNDPEKRAQQRSERDEAAQAIFGPLQQFLGLSMPQSPAVQSALTPQQARPESTPPSPDVLSAIMNPRRTGQTIDAGRQSQIAENAVPRPDLNAITDLINQRAASSGLPGGPIRTTGFNMTPEQVANLQQQFTPQLTPDIDTSILEAILAWALQNQGQGIDLFSIFGGQR